MEVSNASSSSSPKLPVPGSNTQPEEARAEPPGIDARVEAKAKAEGVAKDEVKCDDRIDREPDVKTKRGVKTDVYSVGGVKVDRRLVQRRWFGRSHEEGRRDWANIGACWVGNETLEVFAKELKSKGKSGTKSRRLTQSHAAFIIFSKILGRCGLLLGGWAFIFTCCLMIGLMFIHPLTGLVDFYSVSFGEPSLLLVRETGKTNEDHLAQQGVFVVTLQSTTKAAVQVDSRSVPLITWSSLEGVLLKIDKDSHLAGAEEPEESSGESKEEKEKEDEASDSPEFEALRKANPTQILLWASIDGVDTSGEEAILLGGLSMVVDDVRKHPRRFMRSAERFYFSLQPHLTTAPNLKPVGNGLFEAAASREKLFSELCMRSAERRLRVWIVMENFVLSNFAFGRSIRRLETPSISMSCGVP